MNAEVLLMFTLSCDRAYLYGHPERELSADEHERYDEALAERSRGIPAQYITEHQEFWGLDLIVNPSVLIPRPETEHVIETVLELVREAGDTASRKLRIVDVGTGSGCIALALATELRTAEIWAADISSAALEVARINAARLQMSERIHFLQGDLLAEIPAPVTGFDFVVSNPPYVGEGEADKVQREVRKFEPHAAVFAGPEGLHIITRLVPQARRHLAPGGWLVMEIGYTQEAVVRALFPLKDWLEVRSVNDLQGIPRVIAARRNFP